MQDREQEVRGGSFAAGAAGEGPSQHEGAADNSGDEEYRRLPDLDEELRLLGAQLGEALKKAWESETSREIQGQISRGFKEMARQFDEVADKVAASEERARLRQQVKRVVETARESEMSQEIQEGLLAGLKELNEQLEKLIQRLNRQQEEGSGHSDSPAGAAES